MTFDRKTVFLKSTEFFHRVNPDSSVMLINGSEQDDHFYKISGVAVMIWQKIDGVATVGEILDQILEEYDVSQEVLLKDSETFLKKLIDLKIIM